jgi:hypothetical protein
VQFKSDGNIKTLAMTTEKALKALTRKKPDNDHARMMFLWSGSGTSRTHLGEPAFDALSGFLEAYCHGVSSTLVSEDVCHSR